jgi:hypothetical protein
MGRYSLFIGWLVLLALYLAGCFAFIARGQNIEDQPIASQYSTWQVAGYAPNTYTGFAPTSCRVQGGASFFSAFTVGTPIKIVDGNPALTETVTPTQVTINNNTCAIKIAPVNHHNLPFYLASATGGLQEALNANIASPTVNTIILDGKFYASVGSANVASVIGSVIGFADLGLVDITQTPYAWYAWNGMQYVRVTVGGDVTSVFGRTGAVTAQTGDYNVSQITGAATSGANSDITSLSAITGQISLSSTASIVLASGASINVAPSTTIGTAGIASGGGIFGNLLVSGVAQLNTVESGTPGGFVGFVTTGGPAISTAGLIDSGILQSGIPISEPAVVASAGAGSGATAALATGTTNMAGTISINLGTSPSADSVLAAITFGVAYSSANYFVIVTPSDQAAGGIPIFVTGKTTTGFSLSSAGVAPTSGTLSYDFVIIQGSV